MLRFLKKVTQRELEDINEQLRLNASNNYRDATLDNLKELETKYRELSEKGRLNKEQSEHYGKMIDDYKAENTFFNGLTFESLRVLPIKNRKQDGKIWKPK